MKWSVTDNWPPIFGAGAEILLNGETVERVTAFDTEEGWVERHCRGDRKGHPESPHVDPDDDTRVCRVRDEGRVEIRWPDDGPPEWLVPYLEMPAPPST